MTGLSTAQNVRLGLFVVVAGCGLAATLLALFGVAAMEARDAYTVRFEGSVSGLAVGSVVKYNGIDVGRVEALEIPQDQVSSVDVVLSLRLGTPIFGDTVGVLQMQGITGLKFIELSSPGHGERLRPGERIQSARSSVDTLSESAGLIAEQLQRVLANVSVLTGPKTAARLDATLAEVAALSADLRTIVSVLTPRTASIVDGADGLIVDARATLAAARTTLGDVSRHSDRVAGWVDAKEVAGALRAVNATLDDGRRALAEVHRLAQNGAALAHHADLTVLRAREDLLKVLTTAVEAMERMSELAELLRDDPSALLTGVAVEERKQ
jgi:phospholipid/cholesterol/gamma-HCH transport system substrate-binding protein